MANDAADQKAGLDPEVFKAEWDDIKKRRNKHGPLKSLDGSTPDQPDPNHGLVGMALSGGGIRSASFNLGVLQAFHDHDKLRLVDYLCTVSGGGYIGSCLSSAYVNNEEFPFAHKTGEAEGKAIVHLRENSRYLAPEGFLDLLRMPALALRGLIINFLIVLPILLLAAIATTLLTKDQVLQMGKVVPVALDQAREEAKSTEKQLADARKEVTTLEKRLKSGAPAPFDEQGLAAAKKRVGELERSGEQLRAKIDKLERCRPWTMPSVIARPLMRLFQDGEESGKCVAEPTRDLGRLETVQSFTVSLILLALFAAFCALYPVGQALNRSSSWGERNFATKSLTWVLFLAGVSALVELQPVAVVLFHDPTPKIKELLGLDAKDTLTLWTAIIGLAASVFSGPLAKKAESVVAKADKIGFASKIGAKLSLYAIAVFGPLVFWIIYLNLTRWAVFEKTAPFDLGTGPLLSIYAAASLPLLILWIIVDVNRTSFHNFYRDRLTKSFLFGKEPAAGQPMPPNDTQPLHELNPERGPYQLISTALNIQHSKTSNMRGRNADFFLFSKNFIGSQLTGYRRTEEYEGEKGQDGKTAKGGIDPHVNLGTAMAISGAAAAPNSGKGTIKALTFVMAMLNVRLGYWLPNPKFAVSPGLGPLSGAARRTKAVGPFYLFREMIGRLDEESKHVNLSDGGHVENLGIYELLRRRCKYIIASDAECDPDLSFGSLAHVIRIARIDMGIQIRLSVKQIGKKGGPHCAVGKIEYGGGPNDVGHLLYLKSSVSGDENRYILEYKGRNSTFPHETTSDQFFDEAQFEAYRALGHHIASRALSGTDQVEQFDTVQPKLGDLANWIKALEADLAAAKPQPGNP